MTKAIVTIVCSIVGAIIGVSIGQRDITYSLLTFIWVGSGFGGNVAVEILDGFPMFKGGRGTDGSISFLEALGCTLLFLFLKSMAGPIFPIKNIIRFFRGE